MDQPRTRPRDLNRLAAQLVRDATEPADDSETPAQENGRKGGLKGGRARADKLSPERRAEIARVAAQARWQPCQPLQLERLTSRISAGATATPATEATAAPTFSDSAPWLSGP